MKRPVIALASLLLMACPVSEPTTTPEPETVSAETISAAETIIECVKEKGIYCFCPDNDCSEYLSERETDQQFTITIGGPAFDCIH